MPCYGCQLKLFHRGRPISLSNINIVACHGKILTGRTAAVLIFLAAVPAASPQSGRPVNVPPPPPPDEATVERPDFSVRIPRPNAPARGDYDITADNQESENGVYHLHG